MAQRRPTKRLDPLQAGARLESRSACRAERLRQTVAGLRTMGTGVPTRSTIAHRPPSLRRWISRSEVRKLAMLTMKRKLQMSDPGFRRGVAPDVPEWVGGHEAPRVPRDEFEGEVSAR
jgi:hypothetical protein